MMTPQNEKATGQGGSSKVDGGQAKTKQQKKTHNSGVYHINKVVKGIREAGLQLRSTSGDTQLATLPKVLQFRGEKGLSTYEAVAAGYLRIATRIKELKETWEIVTRLEDVVGPDGLFHKGVARYVLVGKKRKDESAQPQPEMEAA
jgi:hypothetical protein